MKDQKAFTAADKRDQDTMFRLWQERGSMTAKQLLAAGINEASQTRNTPIVAERIRLSDPIAA